MAMPLPFINLPISSYLSFSPYVDERKKLLSAASRWSLKGLLFRSRLERSANKLFSDISPSWHQQLILGTWMAKLQG